MSSDNPDLSWTPAAANRFYSPLGLPVPGNHPEHDASTEVNGIFGRPTPAENDSGRAAIVCGSHSVASHYHEELTEAQTQQPTVPVHPQGNESSAPDNESITSDHQSPTPDHSQSTTPSPDFERREHQAPPGAILRPGPQLGGGHLPGREEEHSRSASPADPEGGQLQNVAANQPIVGPIVGPINENTALIPVPPANNTVDAWNWRHCFFCVLGVFLLSTTSIVLAFFVLRYTHVPVTPSSADIRQSDVIILPLGDHYCVSPDEITSLNISESLPPHSTRLVHLFKHQGDRNTLRNYSSVDSLPNAQLDLAGGNELLRFYAASYALVSFKSHILNVVPSPSAKQASLTLYIVGSIEDTKCFEDQLLRCDYIKKFALNSENGSFSAAEYQAFRPGYYFLYILAQNAEMAIAFNYTVEHDYLKAADFTQPVCVINEGDECKNITLTPSEGAVCFVAYAVSSGDDDIFFQLDVKLVHHPQDLRDGVTVFLLVLWLIALLLVVVLVASLVAFACKRSHEVRGQQH